MTQQNQRSSADDYTGKDHPKTRAEGQTGGNAGAGKSGSEGLGTEKKTDDERFGSRKHEGGDQEHEDAGKKDEPGK